MQFYLSHNDNKKCNELIKTRVTFLATASANFIVFISRLFLSVKRLSWSDDVPYTICNDIIYCAVGHVTHHHMLCEP